MFDKVVKFVKTITSLDIKKLIAVLTLISMISGGIFWMQSTYVSANDFSEFIKENDSKWAKIKLEEEYKIYVIANNYKWAKLQLERINDQIYYWSKKIDGNPNDGYAKKKLMELKQEELLLLEKIKYLEKLKGV